jgi:hypothetical protein
VTSQEHNLLPFSTPQSYALLSVESKATEAANNKERLDERHDIVCIPGLGLAIHDFLNSKPTV